MNITEGYFWTHRTEGYFWTHRTERSPCPMTKQLMKLTIPYNSSWKIIMNDSDKYNKFWVYRIHDEHTKLLVKFADMASCLHFITQQITGHVWRMTDERVEKMH
jgi:hypothetical protein